jgi:hypothetical protein
MALKRGGSRSLALAVPPLLAVAAVVACTTSQSNAPSLGDGGLSEDGGPLEDSAFVVTLDANACSPASVATFAPRWVAPRAYAAACTAEQITSYATCLSSNNPASTDCAPWGAVDGGVNSACRACLLDSSSTDGAWGPIVDYGQGVRQPNVAGCVALATGQDTGVGCAGDYEQLQGCEMQACAANCASSSAALTACVANADSAGCSTYAGLASCSADAGPAATCIASASASFVEVFRAIAPVFCQIPPDAGVGESEDGGLVVLDGGGDGGDAAAETDAGDGGD